MKQVLRKGIADIIVDEIPDPVAAAHHVLVQPIFSLISSGTETASIHQEGVLKEVADNPSHIRKVWEVMKVMGPIPTAREVLAKFSEYAALGYSGAGLVVEKHPTVTDLSIGDRVAYGGEGTGHAQTIVTGRQLVARIPAAVPFEHACFATLGSIALNTVRNAQLSLGDTVVVIGLGLVGQLVAQLARLQGGRVIALDLKGDRVALAGQLGAPHPLLGGPGATEAVSQLTNGRGADCVIIAAAAKSAGPCRQALELCRERGRIVVVGAVEMSFPWSDMYMKEIQLFMARAYGPGSYDPAYEKKGQDYPYAYVRWTENRNMEEFLRLVDEKSVQLDPLITHRFPLEQAPQAYQTIMDPAQNSLAVLLNYPPATPEQFQPRRSVAAIAAPAAPSSTAPHTLRFALAGAGNLARWSHVPNLNKIPGTSLRAVQSGGGVRAKSYAIRFRAAYAATDFNELLRDPEIDALIITSRNQYHARQAVEALHAGKHVFVEKPMAITVEECQQVVRAVAETGRHLSVGFNRRFAPFYVALKQKLTRRNSAPVVINCRVNSPGISGSYWMADPAIGGAILGEACHFIDLMAWLLDAEPASVAAYSLPTGQADPIGENNLCAAFHFTDGSIANLTYCTVGSRTSGGERVEIFSPGLGLISEDFKYLSLRETLARNRRRFWAHKGYREQLAAFVHAIRTNGPQPVTARDGARASIVCLQMLESCRTQQPVRTDWERALA
ncbi:MAG: bi-domain-containing oxidoreductase [Bryobacteraceae bacterium]|nr:bi-domain-containing oxidoreductase [Bryobacteraceae bacterium]